jgi:hypothetical protein
MKVYEPDSWQSLRDKLFELDTIPQETGFKCANLKIFRGQKNPDWLLESKMERLSKNHKNDLNSDNYKKTIGQGWYRLQCDSVLSRFKQNLRKISTKYNFDIPDEEAWILGRHHGLNTPYLDWTTNPLKALYFSFEEIYGSLEVSNNFPLNQNTPVALYKLNLYEDLLAEKEFEFISPINLIGSRMNAQSCCFTNFNTNDANIEEYLMSIGKSDYLEKFLISGKLTKEIISHLYESEIDALALFPDLTGAALQANNNIKKVYEYSKMGNEFKKIKRRNTKLLE